MKTTKKTATKKTSTKKTAAKGSPGTKRAETPSARTETWVATSVDVGEVSKPRVVGIYGTEDDAKAAVMKDMDAWKKRNVIDKDDEEDLVFDRGTMSAFLVDFGREWNVEKIR